MGEQSGPSPVQYSLGELTGRFILRRVEGERDCSKILEIGYAVLATRAECS